MGRALGSLVLLLSAARAEIALNGRVTDENSAPLAGVRVTLGRFLAVSDPGGAFVIRVDSAGEYSLSAQREGYYQAQERAVRLSDGPNEIALTLQTIREVFESVTVAASPPGIDTSTTAVEHAITGAQILEAPYPTTHSLRHALRLFPNVVRDAAGGLHINGGAEEQVLYTLDGFNLTDPLTGRFESRLSVEAVRTVEISSGRFPAEFGKGSSGTMSIRSRTGDDKLRYSATNFIPGIGFHKGFGLQDWVPRFNLSGPIRKGRAWFSDGLDTQYIRHIVEELPRGQDRTQSWRWNNLLHGQVNLTPSNILTAGFLANYWNAPRAGLDALNPPETTIDRRARQWFFYVKEQLYVRRGWLVEVGYARNRTFGREIPQGSDLFRLTPEGQRGNYFIDATRKAGRDQALANLFLPALEAMGAHQIKLGLDLDRLHYEQDVRRSGYEHYRVDGTLLSRVVFGGSGRLDRSNLEAASYIKDSWRVRPNLLVEAGIRQDWDRLVGNTNLSPRLGFGYSPRGLENTRI
ncbi:MAG: TonB-dependent receptor, partial [Acidobacteria bacterium]|nr:TonB-dependent receptor [Acidobacteriota bacterium]